MIKLINDFQINFDVNTEGTVFELVLCIILVSKEIEAYNLIQMLLFVPEWLIDFLTSKDSHFISKLAGNTI